MTRKSRRYDLDEEEDVAFDSEPQETLEQVKMKPFKDYSYLIHNIYHLLHSFCVENSLNILDKCYLSDFYLLLQDKVPDFD